MKKLFASKFSVHSIAIIVYFALAWSLAQTLGKGDVLAYDAQSYYDLAVTISKDGIAKAIMEGNNFIDYGYPIFLSGVSQVAGVNNLLALQLSNYILWFLSSLLIYHALKIINKTTPIALYFLMLFSPLFLTFNAKLYSESYAALGSALIIYALVAIWKSDRFIYGPVLMLGTYILYSTKSVFLLTIPVIIYFLLKIRRFSAMSWLVASTCLLLPLMMSSNKGGRSLYNLAIQSSKVD